MPGGFWWPWLRSEPSVPPVINTRTMEIATNMLSIAAIPLAVLPYGPARSWLMHAAAAGIEVYAYASGGETHGIWCVWYQPLADVRADHNGRNQVSEWTDNWMSLVREASGPRPWFEVSRG